MTHTHWQRFLAAGEEMATEQPAFFPSIVALIEAVAQDNAVRKIVHEAFGIAHELARPGVPVTQIADVLCLVEPRLTELEGELDNAIANMSPIERTQAARWARESYQRAQQEHGCEPLAMPRCVAALSAMLVSMEPEV